MCTCEFRFPEGQKKLLGSLEAGVTGGSEPPNADSGNPVWVLWKSGQCSSLLILRKIHSF